MHLPTVLGVLGRRTSLATIVNGCIMIKLHHRRYLYHHFSSFLFIINYH